jgi:hypothetical protein
MKEMSSDYVKSIEKYLSDDNLKKYLFFFHYHMCFIKRINIRNNEKKEIPGKLKKNYKQHLPNSVERRFLLILDNSSFDE